MAEKFNPYNVSNPFLQMPGIANRQMYWETANEFASGNTHNSYDMNRGSGGNFTSGRASYGGTLSGAPQGAGGRGMGDVPGVNLGRRYDRRLESPSEIIGAMDSAIQTISQQGGQLGGAMLGYRAARKPPDPNAVKPWQKGPGPGAMSLNSPIARANRGLNQYKAKQAGAPQQAAPSPSVGGGNTAAQAAAKPWKAGNAPSTNLKSPLAVANRGVMNFQPPSSNLKSPIAQANRGVQNLVRVQQAAAQQAAAQPAQPAWASSVSAPVGRAKGTSSAEAPSSPVKSPLGVANRAVGGWVTPSDTWQQGEGLSVSLNSPVAKAARGVASTNWSSPTPAAPQPTRSAEAKPQSKPARTTTRKNVSNDPDVKGAIARSIAEAQGLDNPYTDPSSPKPTN